MTLLGTTVFVHWTRDTVWTDERVELLKSLWDQGYSCSEIANELGGGISRNAVIGKANRLHLPGRKITQVWQNSNEPKVARARKPRVPRPKVSRLANRGNRFDYVMVTAPDEIPSTADTDLQIPIEQRRTIMELGEHTCRWPVGEPGSVDFFYCGAEPIHGLPYCGSHCRRSYSPRVSG